MHINEEFNKLKKYREELFGCRTSASCDRRSDCVECDLVHENADIYTKFFSNFPDPDKFEFRYVPSSEEMLVMLIQYPNLATFYLQEKDNKL